jgi:hypothetical protein
MKTVRPTWASTLDIARLNSDCLPHWKIPRVVRIISDSFCIHCCKCWTWPTSVA